MPAGLNLSDRAYFKRAVATREFAMGDYQIGRSHQGTAESVGTDGVPKLFAFTQLRGAEGAGFVSVNIGIPTAVAFAEADRMLKRNLPLLGLAGALAVAAAWVMRYSF